MIGIAHVERAHTRVEERDEGKLLIEDWGHAFVRRVRAEASSTIAEMPAFLRYGVGFRSIGGYPRRSLLRIRWRGEPV
jgi:hypothetical protein